MFRDQLNVLPDSSSLSKEKKILSGRRQQRHSTEIGSEYHRWWAIRNAVGFETNEHIAGLLLDGFHALLEQIVLMCGGIAFKAEFASKYSGDEELSAMAIEPEEKEELTKYKNAVQFYCDTLWQMCGQQDSRLQTLDTASQPMQDFIIRLMGYLKLAKGKAFCLNYKKKKFKQSNFHGNSSKDRELVPKPVATQSETSVNLSSENQISEKTYIGQTCLATGKIQVGKTTQKPEDDPTWSHSLGDLVPPRLGSLPILTKSYVSDTKKCVDNSKTSQQRIEDSIKVSTSSQDSAIRESNFGNTGSDIGGRKDPISDILSKRCEGEGIKSFVDMRDNVYQQPLWPSRSEFPACLDMSKKSGDCLTQAKVSKTSVDPCNQLSQFIENPYCFRKDKGQNLSPEQLVSSSGAASLDGSLRSLYTPRSEFGPSGETLYRDCFYGDLQHDNSHLDDTELWTSSKKEFMGDLSLKKSKGKFVYSSEGLSESRSTVKMRSTTLGHIARESRSFTECLSGLPTQLIMTPQASKQTYLSNGQSGQPQSRLTLPYSQPSLSSRSDKSLLSPTLGATLAMTPTSQLCGNVGLPTPPPLIGTIGTSLPSSIGGPVSMTQPYSLGGTVSMGTSSLLGGPVAMVPTLSLGQTGSMAPPSLLGPTVGMNQTSMIGGTVGLSSTNSLGGTASVALSPMLGGPVNITSSPSLLGGTAGMNPLLLYQTQNCPPMTNVAQNFVYNSLGTVQKPSLSVNPVNVQLNSLMSQPMSTPISQEFCFMNSSEPLSVSSNCNNIPMIITSGGIGTLDFAENRQAGCVKTAECSLENKPVDREKRKYETISTWGRKADSYRSKEKTLANCDKQSVKSNHKRSSPCSEVNSVVSDVQDHSVDLSCNQGRIQDNSDFAQGQSSNANFSLKKTSNAQARSNSCIKSSSEHANDSLKTKDVVRKSPKSQSLGDISESVAVSEPLGDVHFTKPYSVASNSHLETLASLKTAFKKNSKASQKAKNSGKTVSKSSVKLNRSKSKSSQNRRLVCNSCHYIFFSGTDLLVHRYEQHSFVCKECDGRFLSRSHLEEHKAEDHPQILVCQHCRYHTTESASMEAHLRVMHDIQSKTNLTQHSSAVDTTLADSADLSNLVNSTTDSHKHVDKCGDARNNDNAPSGDSPRQTLTPSCSSSVSSTPSIPPAPFLSPAPFLQSTPSLISDGTSTEIKKESAISACEKFTKNYPFYTKPVTIDSPSCSSGPAGTSAPSTSVISRDVTSHSAFPLLPVFPTLSRADVARSDCMVTDSVSSMYSQVLEHLQPDTSGPSTDLTVTEHQWSESDEPPQLVIDMDHSDASNPETDTQPQTPLPVVKDNKKHKKPGRISPVSRRKKASNSATKQSNQRCEEKEKLVVKISLKRPVDKLSDETPKVKKRKKKSKKKTDPPADTSNISSASMKLCDKDKSPKSIDHKDETFGSKVVQKSLDCENENIENKNSNTVSKKSNETRKLSLHERHAMKTLPPKKRNLKKSPRPAVSPATGLLPSGASYLARDLFGSKLTENKDKEMVPQNVNESVSCNRNVEEPDMTDIDTRVHPDNGKADTGWSQSDVPLSSPYSVVPLSSSHSAMLLSSPKSVCPKFPCPVFNCSTTFTRRWSMDMHLKNVHGEIILLKCNHENCSQTFNSRKELRQHITDVHKDPKRTFVCSWPACRRSFNAISHLRVHLLCHGGNKPFECDVCSYKCRQRSTLLWHRRKHGCVPMATTDNL